jgi:hypothetical protein
VSTLRLKPCTNPTMPPAHPTVRGRPPGCPLPGFSPAGRCGGRQGTLGPTAAKRTTPGTVFPWPAARGFCTPRCRSKPRCLSAFPQPPSADRIRPLGLRPRGLGGALWRLGDKLRGKCIFTQHSYNIRRTHPIAHTRGTHPT